MCEPFHSITQFPNQDDDGNPTENRLNFALGKVMNWAKKIGGYFHFSKLGAGHSESLLLTGRSSFHLPQERQFEAGWWDRSFKFDTGYRGDTLEHQESYDCARVYANAVCLGSLSSVRRFLEESMKQTDRIGSYVNMFSDYMLNSKGRDEYALRLKKFNLETQVRYARYRGSFGVRRDVEPDVLAKLIKVTLGFTRKRNLLCDAWANDSKLWLPDQKALTMG